MANSEHLAKLKEGVKEFNEWRVQIGDVDLVVALGVHFAENPVASIQAVAAVW